MNIFKSDFFNFRFLLQGEETSIVDADGVDSNILNELKPILYVPYGYKVKNQFFFKCKTFSKN